MIFVLLCGFANRVCETIMGLFQILSSCGKKVLLATWMGSVMLVSMS